MMAHNGENNYFMTPNIRQDERTSIACSHKIKPVRILSKLGSVA